MIKNDSNGVIPMEKVKSTSLHIKNDYEFRRAYNRGKSFVSPVLVVYCLKRRQPYVRIGITTGKKVGKAVNRSRARRVIREAYYHLLPEISVGWDLVFVARTRTAMVKEQIVEESMLNLLKKAGVIVKKAPAQANGEMHKENTADCE